MLQPLSRLFRGRQVHWDEVDVRHLLQQYLRQQLGTEALYCDSVSGGVAEVRVATPALQQAVLVLEYDLKQLVHVQAQYALERVRVQLVS